MPPSDGQPKQRTATAVLYADIRGFTATLDRIESETLATDKMKHYLLAWQAMRDSLVRDRTGATKGFYLANRVGDAFVILVFEKDPLRWHSYIVGYLRERFAEFAEQVRALDPLADPHLKVSLYSTVDKRVPYYETGVMSDELVRGLTIARRDFLCTAINKCARMDAMPEADTSVLLCNEAVFRWLVLDRPDGGALARERFDDLGEQEFRGFRKRERVYALKPTTT
ncbi:MAG: hypothetical protein Q8Q09_01390 [Deltaproteobacteria bacterium]|nr:hypothetical protein [Deltaproteobacteria bacterium]